MADTTTMERRYDESSITVLEGLAAVQKNPGMYIGGVGSAGLHHLAYEVIDNAVDEALEGYCDSILVRLNADGSCTVVDNGRGIPVENLQRIFERGFTTKPDGKNSGLGLAICKKTVERHGGRIWVESNVAAGSTFYFTLPKSDGT